MRIIKQILPPPPQRKIRNQNQYYNDDFYRARYEKTINSAKIILSLVLDVLPKINSAVDFGCGTGTWLNMLQQYGVERIKGFDGPWVPKKYLTIPEDSFVETNLDKEILLDSKYDLAISLEVAEHLPERSAMLFIDTLTNASDFILFSAAIPLQGGQNHINEQWPRYWNHLFNSKGYFAIDFLRREIWDNQTIPYWYRQNIMLFVRRESIQKVKVHESDYCINHQPLSIVHPETYYNAMNLNISTIPITTGMKILLKRTIKKILK